MNTNQELFAAEMHSFMMDFFNKLNEVEPNPEMMEMLKSPQGLKLIKIITDFYCQILDQEDIQWIIDHNLNGRGKIILDKFIQNMELFRNNIVSLSQEIESI